MKENNEPKNEIIPEELARFRTAIGNYAESEVTGEHKTAHFLRTKDEDKEFDAKYLTEEDMEIWRKVEDGSVSLDEFYKYKDKIGKFLEDNPESQSAFSRNKFYGFITNKVNEITLDRELKEAEEQK